MIVDITIYIFTWNAYLAHLVMMKIHLTNAAVSANLNVDSVAFLLSDDGDIVNNTDINDF